jgi:hypothetical protein
MNNKFKDNNEKIAQFMGLNIKTNNLKYNYCWNHLIPVVEKIENFGYEFIIVESRIYVNHNTQHSIKEVFHMEFISSKIYATYNAVIEFIKMYNKKLVN